MSILFLVYKDVIETQLCFLMRSLPISLSYVFSSLNVSLLAVFDFSWNVVYCGMSFK